MNNIKSLKVMVEGKNPLKYVKGDLILVTQNSSIYNSNIVDIKEDKLILESEGAIKEVIYSDIKKINMQRTDNHFLSFRNEIFLG